MDRSVVGAVASRFVREQVREVNVLVCQMLGILLQPLGIVEDGADRRRYRAPRPSGDIAVVVERARETIAKILTVEIMLNVVFTGPDHLYGDLHFLCDLPGLGGVIPLVTTAEGTSRQRGVNRHTVRRHAREPRDLRLGNRRNLRRRPDFNGSVGAHMHRCVHRLHGGVSLEGQLIGGLDSFPAPSRTFSASPRSTATTLGGQAVAAGTPSAGFRYFPAHRAPCSTSF